MLELNPSTTAIAGDWHSSTAWAAAAVRHAREVLGARDIVHLGDFAYRFDPRFIGVLHREMAHHGMRLHFVRGNHDSTPVLRNLDPTGEGRLAVGLLDDGTSWPLTEDGRITYLPDGLRFPIGGETALVLGGGGSIDRSFRMPGIEWWEDERLDNDQADVIVLENFESGADVLLCHDAPAGVELHLDPRFGKYFESRDPGVLAWCDEHRQRLGRIADATAPRLILHGHHHRAINAARFGQVRDAVSIGLDRDGSTITENLILFPGPF